MLCLAVDSQTQSFRKNWHMGESLDLARWKRHTTLDWTFLNPSDNEQESSPLAAIHSTIWHNSLRQRQSPRGKILHSSVNCRGQEWSRPRYDMDPLAQFGSAYRRRLYGLELCFYRKRCVENTGHRVWQPKAPRKHHTERPQEQEAPRLDESVHQLELLLAATFAR